MFFEHLGTYITMFMRLAYTHQVKLDHNFVCCAMAIKVMEGLAIALDPKLGASDADSNTAATRMHLAFSFDVHECAVVAR